MKVGGNLLRPANDEGSVGDDKRLGGYIAVIISGSHFKAFGAAALTTGCLSIGPCVPIPGPLAWLMTGLGIAMIFGPILAMARHSLLDESSAPRHDRR